MYLHEQHADAPQQALRPQPPALWQGMQATQGPRHVDAAIEWEPMEVTDTETQHFVLPGIERAGAFPSNDVKGFVSYPSYRDVPRALPAPDEADGTQGVLARDEPGWLTSLHAHSIYYQGDGYQLWRRFTWDKGEIDPTTLTHVAGVGATSGVDPAVMAQYTGIDVTVINNPRPSVYVRVYGMDPKDDFNRITIWDESVADCVASADRAECKIKCAPGRQSCSVHEKRYLSLGTKGKHDDTRLPSPAPTPPSSSASHAKNTSGARWKGLTALVTLFLAGMAPWIE